MIISQYGKDEGRFLCGTIVVVMVVLSSIYLHGTRNTDLTSVTSLNTNRVEKQTS